MQEMNFELEFDFNLRLHSGSTEPPSREEAEGWQSQPKPPEGLSVKESAPRKRRSQLPRLHGWKQCCFLSEVRAARGYCALCPPPVTSLQPRPQQVSVLEGHCPSRQPRLLSQCHQWKAAWLPRFPHRDSMVERITKSSFSDCCGQWQTKRR